MELVEVRKHLRLLKNKAPVKVLTDLLKWFLIDFIHLFSYIIKNEVSKVTLMSQYGVSKQATKQQLVRRQGKGRMQLKMVLLHI